MEIFNPEKIPLTGKETVTDFDVNLLREIIHDFSHHSFNLSDAIEVFNRQEPQPSHDERNLGMDNIKESLNVFVKQGILDYDPKTKQYNVNHTSSVVARMSEEEDDD